MILYKLFKLLFSLSKQGVISQDKSQLLSLFNNFKVWEGKVGQMPTITCWSVQTVCMSMVCDDSKRIADTPPELGRVDIRSCITNANVPI